MDLARSDNSVDDDWLNSYLDDEYPVLNDRMITDACKPIGKVLRENEPEHNYSLSCRTSFNNDSDFMSDDGSVDDLDSDMPSFFISSDVVKNAVQQQTPHIYIKSESGLNTQQPKFIVTTSQSLGVKHPDRLVLPKFIKVERLGTVDGTAKTGFTGSPPTPPASSSSSDSDGSSSPLHSCSLSSPIKQETVTNSSIRMQAITNAVITDLSKLPQSGPLLLSEEEKRTLMQEGYPVPIKLPLTKSEEKVLKKIRRKIKNKISAQESRRKKKEYVDALEKMCENFSGENMDLRKKLESLQNSNKSMSLQLQKLQALTGKLTQDVSIQTAGTSLLNSPKN
ncbi:PREDICTED: cyclic AMP-responsive element-binding protein 3-like protein 2 isoform X1 [Priapulus caudatus]|uniref:Cyclic AMP-responsive element-binding protein 3-like protein 2 isoform X1 n=1 Tax=Priapulus caudatus TaxID=37621 RepID=A0ABM1DYQ8_PRICU|nr:PREDICTED: cyclic AMP-responsive element-binding protein 3-like protein 2 isoform X1 [Priapulus caudatus]XP_014665077.1 PREDICTED: cyclic AMP-responsive element-binding protein 3-like protein 2 isoform X1 [Priapulus caudatus]XP_014665078.1 PREDICTED: cyclic AMP-responsive element-binding protein 3-like protein 2 isoform X1 [Priapulus caudatus]XP_014665079.1 PREDICTED: cyclic AMP-responsive element-binding protein 3-like protein 2 isoform X1 [Priapulus caudatus]